MPKKEKLLVLAVFRHRRDHIVRKRSAELICLLRTKIIRIGMKIPQQISKITIE